MADTPIVNVVENSPEHVAFLLFREIAKSEKKNIINPPQAATEAADRKWILDTYAECLRAVKDPYGRANAAAGRAAAK
jgi:hypothetical protein